MIPDKDQKILWARAAGRCSMSECRIKLTLNKEEETDAITLGEMCHIVGEKNNEKSPRGKSKMALDDRNRYSNLILLCVHHHRLIDRNEKAWPIEILHKIKAEHEIWVDESLESKKLTPDDLFYAETTDMITYTLRLEQWNWFMDNAVNQIVHHDFIQAGSIITERLLAIDWPGTKKELESAMINLFEAYKKYIVQYLERARPRDGASDFFSRDVSYKLISHNPNYQYEAIKNDLWARKNFLLLCKYTIMLNRFVKCVRIYSNPYYFKVRGTFLIVDEGGTHLGDDVTFLAPESIPDIENKIKKIDDERERLERKQSKK